MSSAVDWVSANTPADPDKLAVSGISYGAGLSLLALAQDKRLKTAAALSGWGDLVDQLYGAESPNATWSSVLFLSGKVTGRLDPIVDQYVKALLDPNTTQAKVEEITAWAQARSPSTYLDTLNRRGAPIFISKNFEDDMHVREDVERDRREILDGRNPVEDDRLVIGHLFEERAHDFVARIDEKRVIPLADEMLHREPLHVREIHHHPAVGRALGLDEIAAQRDFEHVAMPVQIPALAAVIGDAVPRVEFEFSGNQHDE